MTEIPDLGAFFGQMQQPQFTAEQQRHIEAVHQFEHRQQVQKFAAILCTCNLWGWDRWDSEPPQMSCVIHGSMQVNPCTDEIIMPGMGPLPAAFTAPKDNHDDNDHDRPGAARGDHDVPADPADVRAARCSPGDHRG
jgi:hypothetical protein